MELQGIIDQFLNKKILIIGDVMLDKYTIGHVSRINPEAPVPVLAVEKEIYKPGGAGNVALNVRNLSGNENVYLFGFVGEDPNGRELKRILENKGIKCYFEKNSTTIMKERIIGRSSGQEQQMVRVDREEIADKKIMGYINKLLEIAAEVDKIIISDYGKGAITIDLINYLIPYKNKIIIDPKPSNKSFREIYKDVFLITPNKKEALEMSGCDNIKDAGYFLKNEFKSNILITMGKDGILFFPIEKDLVHIPTNPKESFEETGAGDTTIAALALAIKDNTPNSIINAAKLANYAAGITIEHMGTYSPSLEELKLALKNENTEFRTT